MPKREPPELAQLAVSIERLELAVEDSVREITRLRARLHKLSDLLSGVPGLPVAAYRLLRG